MGVGVSCYFRTPWYELESNQWHMDFQSIALPAELSHQIRAWEILCVASRLIPIHWVFYYWVMLPFLSQGNNTIFWGWVPLYWYLLPGMVYGFVVLPFRYFTQTLLLSDTLPCVSIPFSREQHFEVRTGIEPVMWIFFCWVYVWIDFISTIC